MKAVMIILLFLAFLTGYDAAGGQLPRSSAPAADAAATANDLGGAVGALLNRHVASYHVLLRELSLVVEPRCLGRPWSTVEKELKGQGLHVVDWWENGAAINCHYIVASNAFTTPAGYPMDLYLMVQAENIGYATATQQVGRVFIAIAALVSDVHQLYSNLVSQARFPKGSVIEKVLDHREVRKDGRIWPMVKRVYASYGYLFDRWSEYSPSGFRVEIEYELGRANDFGVKSGGYMVPSGLDPLKSETGQPESLKCTSNDSLGEITQTGSLESWRGDDDAIVKLKAKYLKEEP